MEKQAESKDKFFICGLMVCRNFQIAKFLANKMYKSFPNNYHPPEIRAMLDLEWDEYILKERRILGNGVWRITNVIVFINDKFLGDEETLLKELSKKFRFNLSFDWHSFGVRNLNEYLSDIISNLRQMVHITVAINKKIVGTMLFELYSDLVPVTCENFLKNCASAEGYLGRPIHRIVKGSWLQCGGHNSPKKHMRCESYVVAHNRRGVLGMCNAGRHRHNTFQFYITLDSTSWMDHKFVAFGQLIQGNNILKQIEIVPTSRESPDLPIDIVQVGQFKLSPFKDETDLLTKTELNAKDSETLHNIFSEPASVMDVQKYNLGHYCMQSDLKSHFPFSHLPDYLYEIIDSNQGVESDKAGSIRCSEYDPVGSSSESDATFITL